ncbi:MAG TPA: ATP-binding cassette domain-containing protein [Planctomycetaceae bacterium]|nr:ATP-binding cassette domain-containing protein [Planctomycetaceae bacterium]
MPHDSANSDRPPPPRPLWTLNDVTLRGGGRPRLECVSLEIHPGRTAVLGYSGAGKTSLLNLLVRFERPTAGTLCAEIPAEARLPLFWVPDNDGLWPHLTASEHLHSVSRDATHCRGLLDGFDLAALAPARPDRLSRGERSRLAVARALASEAVVLVMDEPLAHVDPARLGRYWDVLRAHCRERSTSLVFATHAPETAIAESDRVVCLKDGRLCYTGNVETLYRDPPSAELAAYLGPANWFDAGEAARWLEEPRPGRRCYRPEQLRIVGHAAGRLVVEAVRFCGSHAEVDVRHETDGAARRLFHRPAAHTLTPGDRVAVRVSEP